MSRTAQHGDRVTVSYIGTLDNGRIFDSTEENPLTIKLGADEVFPALEKEIVGMAVGQVKNICLCPRDAYGPRRPENVLRVKRELFPADKELRVGQKLEVEFGDAGRQVMLILDHDDEEVALDGNHPLAGLDLTFALRLDAIL
ncbi:MAG: peptidylprolyl isomerase [Desulfuromonas sp.]|nr:MAG: peptidylprolyl isomerase [Desulfuromonas sp.]